MPPLNGVVHRWHFPSGAVEARAVAESCRNLIASGVSARDILVLLSNQRILLQPLVAEFRNEGIVTSRPVHRAFSTRRPADWCRR